MRPYLAVIRDSFHEALVSRVLWILLAMTTLVLVSLLPLGFIEQAGSYLQDDDFLNREKLAEKIVAQGASQQPSPGHRIWELLDEPTRQALVAKTNNNRFENRLRFRGLADSFRSMVTRRDFYRETDWKLANLSAPAKVLLAKGLANLADDELARFNRLALESAFPDEIAPIPRKQIQLAYFSWELGLPLPVEPEQLFSTINQVLVVVLGYLLGVVGVFVAVLVTASMIPQTFEAGSVDLLLSKPVYRGWLFLAKFVGGCAFIAINAIYFIGGLWLVLGLRFGLWNERLLLAIPLYLFLFAIYYGVSALAGIVWRNAIVSVVLAVLFWFVCWILGTAVQLVETISLAPRRFVTMAASHDTLVAVNAQSEVFHWEDGQWHKIFGARHDEALPFMFVGSLAGPIFDAAGDRILAFKLGPPGISPFPASNKLLVGKREDDWRRSEGVNLPEGAYVLLLGARDEILVVSAQGVYRLQGDLEAKQQDINVFGLHIPLPEKGGRFIGIGPRVQLRQLQSAAVDRQTGAVALFDGYRLLLFQREEDKSYKQKGEVSFEHRQSGEVALAAGRSYLALDDGEIRTYDFELKPGPVISSGVRGGVESAVASPDGRLLAIRYRNGHLWLYDIRQDRAVPLEIAGQGDISAVAFDNQKMFVADRLTRITEYDLDRLQVGQQLRTDMPLAETIYRYVLNPLYTVFPKPSQLNATVSYLLTANESPFGSMRINNNRVAATTKVDVWGPIWSNLAFLIVVLSIACVYIYRKDF